MMSKKKKVYGSYLAMRSYSARKFEKVAEGIERNCTCICTTNATLEKITINL